MIELAVALHHVFDTPEDKIIWDVGHQVRIFHFMLVLSEDETSLAISNNLSEPDICRHIPIKFSREGGLECIPSEKLQVLQGFRRGMRAFMMLLVQGTVLQAYLLALVTFVFRV